MTFPFFHKSHKNRRSATSAPRRIGPALETLEDRSLLTAYVFVDFGDNFPNRVLSTTVGAVRDVAAVQLDGNNIPIPDTVIPGPHLLDADEKGYPDTFAVNLAPFSFVDGQRAEIMANTRRAFAGLDVAVVELRAGLQFVADGRYVAGATNMAGVVATLRGNNNTSKDVYVIVAMATIGPGGDNPRSLSTNRYGGIAPTGEVLGETTDLSSSFNNHDDLVLSFRKDANTIVHEAGHAFGVQHAVTTAAPATSAINNAIHTSEIMSYLAGAGDTSVYFTRYPMVRGDSNTDTPPLPPPPEPPPDPPLTAPLSDNDLAARQGQLTPFDQLRIDPNVGENPNLHYISGTGAHDQITVTRGPNNTAHVEVRAFTDNSYTSAILAPGTTHTRYSYSVDLDRPLLIQAGLGDDQITLDGDLGVSVDVDGMGGSDRIIVTADANFVLTESNLEIAGLPSITLANLENASLTGGPGDNRFDVSDWRGDAALEGLGGTNTVVSFNNSGFVLADSQLSVTRYANFFDLINIQDAVLVGRAPGIDSTSANNLFDVSGWTGTATLDAADGFLDALQSENDADFVLTNTSLTRSTGGSFTLRNFETVTLIGGAGSNSFDVGGWTLVDNGIYGAVYLKGQDGFDTVVAAQDVDFGLRDEILSRSRSVGNQLFSYGRVVLISVEHAVLTGGLGANAFTLQDTHHQATVNGGGGADRLILDDRTSTVASTFSITSTRVSFDKDAITGSVAYSNIPTLTIDAGSGGNTYTVLSTAAATTTTIRAGAGTDTVAVTEFVQTLHAISGQLVVQGNGATSLVLDDRRILPAVIPPSAYLPLTNSYQITNQKLMRSSSTRIISLTTGAAVDGVSQLTLDYSNLADLVVYDGLDSREGVNSFHVLNTAGANRVILNASGQDAIHVGGENSTLNPIGNLVVNGGNGTKLNLHDEASANFIAADQRNDGTWEVQTHLTSPAYVVSSQSIARTNVVSDSLVHEDRRGHTSEVLAFSSAAYSASINYFNVASLTIHGGQSGNAYNILSTPAGTDTAINAGNGADVLGISPIANDLGSIAGNLILEGQAGIDSLTLDDRSAAGAHNYSLSGSELTRDGAAPIQFAGIENPTLNAGGAATPGVYSVITVTGTSGLAGTTRVIGGSGLSLVNVEATSSSLYVDSRGSSDVVIGSTGTMATINGPVDVRNSNPLGQTALFVQDGSNPNSKSGVILDDGALVGLSVAPITWTSAPNSAAYGGVVAMFITGAAGGTDFAIQNTSPFYYFTLIQTFSGTNRIAVRATTGELYIEGDRTAENNVILGSLAPSLGGTLASINGSVRAYGASGASQSSMFLSLDDSGATNSDPKGARLGVDGAFHTVSGMSPASIYYLPASSSEAGVRQLNIYGGQGSDRFTAGSPLPTIPVNIDGGGGSNILQGPDAASDWRITDWNAGTLNGVLSFTSIQNLTGGAQSDSFRLIGPASLTGQVDGGGGINTLDYSTFTTRVIVNLLAGQATAAAAGIVNFANAIGGAGDDTLIGNDLDNVLTGNGGNDLLLGLGGSDRLNGGLDRDILSGGQGADLLDGGFGDDILNGGYTDYDTQIRNGIGRHDLNLDALNAVMAEWASASSYNERFGAIKTGVGANGQYRLDPTNVHDDLEEDTLTGSDGQDWFFVLQNGDTVTDLNFNPSDPKNKKEKTTNIK